MSLHVDGTATMPIPAPTQVTPPSAANAVTITPLPAQEAPEQNYDATTDNDTTTAGTTTRQRTGAQAAQVLVIHDVEVKVAARFAAILSTPDEAAFVPPTRDERVLALIEALGQNRIQTVYWNETHNGVSQRVSGKLSISGRHGGFVLTTSDNHDHAVKESNVLGYLSTTADVEIEQAKQEYAAKQQAVKNRKSTLGGSLGVLADIKAGIKARAGTPAGTPTSRGE